MIQKKNYLFRVILFLLIVAWCAGFSLRSFSDHPLAFISYPFLKLFYSVVCHQHPEKTIELFGFNLLVCARCTGIYAGALIASAAMLFININFKISLKVILLAAAPMLADVVLYSTGVYEYSTILAFFTGMFSGSLVIFYILTSVEKLFVELKLKNETK